MAVLNHRWRIHLTGYAAGIAVGNHLGVLDGNTCHCCRNIFRSLFGADVGAQVAGNDAGLAGALDLRAVEGDVLHRAVEHTEEAGVNTGFASEIGDGVALAVEVDGIGVGCDDVERVPAQDSRHIDIRAQLEPSGLALLHELEHLLQMLGSVEYVRRGLGALPVEGRECRPGRCVAHGDFGENSSAHLHILSEGEIVGLLSDHGDFQSVGRDTHLFLTNGEEGLDRASANGQAGECKGKFAILAVPGVVEGELDICRLQRNAGNGGGSGGKGQGHRHNAVGTECPFIVGGPLL